MICYHNDTFVLFLQLKLLLRLMSQTNMAFVDERDEELLQREEDAAGATAERAAAEGGNGAAAAVKLDAISGRLRLATVDNFQVSVRSSQ